MIERWFPCAEVSTTAGAGWGSGNQERNLFTWFAARPTSQAKAAVLCSLLPWPEDPAEQTRLQQLVQEAMTGRYAAWTELRAVIAEAYPGGISTLDPFSGRGMIPLEAARLGLHAEAVDYSPVAVLASHLLTDFPFRDWTGEPALPIASAGSLLTSSQDRLLADCEAVMDEIAVRLDQDLKDFYPRNDDGRYPWGYLWAVGIPCQECGRRFPLVGSYELIRARGRHAAQSFFIESVDGVAVATVHDGPPDHQPTLRNAVLANGKKATGKSAICVHCQHVHTLETHRRLVNDGEGRDVLLLAADIDKAGAKEFRAPTYEERQAVELAQAALVAEPNFTPFLPAIPDEQIRPGNNNVIGPSIYGARTYGDFMVGRQTLYNIRLARIISTLGDELTAAGISREYARALTGYAAAVVVKKLRRSTRGARMQAAGGAQVGDLFVNEGSITFSHDFFEAGLGDGPGTWTSIAKNVRSVLRSLLNDSRGRSASVQRGSATALPMADSSVSVVVTDPPYDEMIAYSDASDLFYAWVKRCLHTLWPDLTITEDEYGAQDKELEIIVKRARGLARQSEYTEHRTREHYDTLIQQAFKEMRRVVDDDGVVTIVFGHGQPEVWQRLLDAISGANLVMTGSWPARTEAGGSHGNAHIETTLTMACRPAPPDRPIGRKGTVEAEIEAEICRRYPDWERWGLAPTDMLMAAAGPAMEVVGRYAEVLDARGEHVDIYTFLPLARASVQRAMAVDVGSVALESFDAPTRFALWWVRLYGRNVQAKSELRWQALAASIDPDEVRPLIPDTGKGVAFTTSESFDRATSPTSPVIDVALALARVSEDGLAAMGETLARSGRSAEDPYLWAAVTFLADRLPDGDDDAIAFTRVLRARAGVGAAAEAAVATVAAVLTKQDLAERQGTLL
jgi:adenine-specific DNA methylase